MRTEWDALAGFPEKAKVVIIGLGGIVGASVAHHLVGVAEDSLVSITPRLPVLSKSSLLCVVRCKTF